MNKNQKSIMFDDAPLSRFHIKVTAFTTGGQFCDGYILGIIGIALAVYAPLNNLTPFWEGLIGSGALIGLFFGSLIFGPIIDKIGRQTMFLIDLWLFIIGSILHFFATDPWQLLTLRLFLGFAMGIDYAISGPLMSEMLPRKHRGTLMATLNAVWTLGFVVAYVTGYIMKDVLGPDSWRWMLVSSVVPAVIVLLLRLGSPESPRWLASHGKHEEARRVLDKFYGAHVILEEENSAQIRKKAPISTIFSKKWRNRTIFSSLFWFCQVLPYFAILTFSPIVLSKIGLKDEFTGGLALNLFQVVGAIFGVAIMSRVSRKGFTFWSFILMVLALLPLVFSSAPSAVLVVSCFAIYAFAIAAGGNLCHVYPSEIFPTAIRATGVGFAAAVSRIGAAIGTFLLPMSLATLGTQVTLLAAVVILMVGAVVTAFLAPETRNLTLVEASAI